MKTITPYFFHIFTEVLVRTSANAVGIEKGVNNLIELSVPVNLLQGSLFI